MYDVHHGLIGKRVVDFLLVLLNVLRWRYGRGATGKYPLKIGDFASTGGGERLTQNFR